MAARFWDSHAGAGPRSTPTLRDGRVYTVGATGILNPLDAATGGVVWSRNAAVDTEATVPGWGFASSPLVVDDVVMVAVGGIVAAYDSATGNPRWSGADVADGENDSSPHLMSLDGVEQALLMSATGTTSVEPANGRCSGSTSGLGSRSCSRPRPRMVTFSSLPRAGAERLGCVDWQSPRDREDGASKSDGRQVR